MNGMRMGFLLAAALGAAMSLALFAPSPPSFASQPQTTAATDVPTPPASAVFELKYHGLDKPDDPLSYRSFWGFGGEGGESDPFVRAVKEKVKDCTTVYHGTMARAQWAVVELKDKKPVAFYFDANADGKLSDNERFANVAASGSNVGFPYAFITSDFLMRTRDRRDVPFRLLLVGSAYGDDQVSYMWSPACVLEGQGTLAGEPMRLFLYADGGFRGSFTSFGSCSFALLAAGQQLPPSLPRLALSSLIQHKGTFYRLQLAGTHEEGKTVRVTLTKDTTPTGQLAIQLQGKEPLKTNLGSATIAGDTDNTIDFELSDTRSGLPEGRYRLSYASAGYGVENNDDWRIMLNQGPVFTIDAGKASQVELGGLTLSIKAVDERQRYQSNAKEQARYVKGTPIYLAPQIKGKAGEVYTRFSRKESGPNNFTDVKPHLTILDANGKTMASADLEYG